MDPTAIRPTPFVDNPISQYVNESLPHSIAQFLVAVDALDLANNRPAGITAEENVIRVQDIFRETIDSSKSISRTELNAFYPKLGDHFFDNAIRHMQDIVQSVDTQNQDLLTEAMGSYVTWQSWWKQNATAVNERIISRYSP